MILRNQTVVSANNSCHKKQKWQKQTIEQRRHQKQSTAAKKCRDKRHKWCCDTQSSSGSVLRLCLKWRLIVSLRLSLWLRLTVLLFQSYPWWCWAGGPRVPAGPEVRRPRAGPVWPRRHPAGPGHPRWELCHSLPYHTIPSRVEVFLNAMNKCFLPKQTQITTLLSQENANYHTFTTLLPQ